SYNLDNWAECGITFSLSVDGKTIYSNVSGVQACLASEASIKPGQSMKESFIFDPTNIAPGRHSLFLKLYNPNVKSNTLNVDISPAKSIGSCYDLTTYASPLCAQISNPGFANSTGICEQFLAYIKNSTPLKPIPSLSDTNCQANDISDYTASLVVNVPKSDTSKWANVLNSYNLTLNPLNGNAVSYETYPQTPNFSF
ncbi:MAG TPA: hypothetical protein VMR76_03175, partial [Candidatus Saccharimonadia bacterium]|nr:hypothetical protein [Candidatus Saccharimonadia bacterium]